MCAKRIKFLMTRLSVCNLGVSCNEKMIDTPMLLVAGAPNSAKFRGGVAEGQPRFDKGGGGGCNIFFTFYALKISLFRVSTLSD